MNTVCEFLSRGQNLLAFTVMLPLFFALLMLVFRKKHIPTLAAVAAGSIANLIVCTCLYFGGGEFSTSLAFGPFGMGLDLCVFPYSALFLFLTSCAFTFVTLYGAVWLKGKNSSGLFLFYMFVSLSMLNGAFLCDSLSTMLFFWEGLLCTLFGTLLIGNSRNYRAALKALTLSGTADLLLMLGIIITVNVAGTSKISEMSAIPLDGIGFAGFICLMLGALGKAGCMPFHSWIPEASQSAPIPFMAAFPGALEKLLGIYLAVRVITNVYAVTPGSAASLTIMAIGAVTLVCGVAMALIQKDMKKLLSYHAISQVGYMVLGIGSALPVGIQGGLFHMLNNVVYKSALFMIAGIIEQKLGTTDLRKFSGLGKKMPVTAVCFTVCGLSIAGVPPFNGFFSKELIFDSALETGGVLGGIFYACALVGAFMTAVSFLKMGRAAFSGKEQLPEGVTRVDEKGLALKAPVCLLSALCVLFGVFNTLPVNGWFAEVTGSAEKHGGLPSSVLLVAVSVFVLLLAVADHIFGCRKSGKPINAADHIHYAPVLHRIYSLAEAGKFDPYNYLTKLVSGFSFVCVKIESAVSFVYDKFVPSAVGLAENVLHRVDNGLLSRYLAAVLAGVLIIAAVFFIASV